jgi:hypothetical protein
MKKLLLSLFPEITSQKFQLEAKDFVTSAFQAVGAAIMPIIIQSIQAGNFTFDWKAIATVGITAFITLLAHKWGLGVTNTTDTADKN